MGVSTGGRKTKGRGSRGRETEGEREKKGERGRSQIK